MAETQQMLAKLLAPTDFDKLDPGREDIDRAYKVLGAKLAGYNDIWDYYDGDQPLMYTAKRMRDLFDDLDMATFVENWCAVVVDAANDRIHLQGLSSENTQVADVLEEIWQDLDLGLEASDVHEAAIVIGEAYIIVWPDEEEEAKLSVFYNDPRLVHLFYDPSNPKRKWYGAKWWVDAYSYVRMTLYYPDRLEYYRSDKVAKSVTNSKSFMPYSPDDTEGGDVVDNEYEEVPIFHFRMERRKTKGDLVNVIPLQNAINKLVTDMMVAAEYGAFRQRWIISNANTEALKNAPNEIWEIPAGDGTGQQSAVGQFEATDLANYIKSIDHLASAVAIISRTPKHFLFQQGGDPSGEALVAMEAPLNKRCEDHIDRFTPTWKEVARFILRILDQEVEKDELIATFDKPETIQPTAEAEIRTQGKAAGIPLVTLLRDEGKDEAWLEQMKKDKEEEVEMNQKNLGPALMNSIRNANQPPPFGGNAEGEEDDNASQEVSE